MKFSEFQKILREHETSSDIQLPSDVEIVIRLDGRGFSRLTNKVLNLKKPFDVSFHGLMLKTTRHLMQCGPAVIYGYFQSDEISLLLNSQDTFCNRRLQKICSILAGEASAVFSLNLGRVASFDCRISQLPNVETIVDYFRWRQEDAKRNALNAYCYWSLRDKDVGPDDANMLLKGMDLNEKLTLLKKAGIDFSSIDSWQKAGTGVFWQKHEIQGENPLIEEPASSHRNRLVDEPNLPTGEAYAEFIQSMIDNSTDILKLGA